MGLLENGSRLKVGPPGGPPEPPEWGAKSSSYLLEWSDQKTYLVKSVSRPHISIPNQQNLKFFPLGGPGGPRVLATF